MMLTLLGHAPAWWHVSTCGNAADRDAATACCSHCACGEAVAGTGAAGTATDGDAPDDSVPHDHDDCFVCQSLLAPVGEDGDEPEIASIGLPAMPAIAAVVPAVLDPAADVRCARGPPRGV